MHELLFHETTSRSYEEKDSNKVANFKYLFHEIVHRTNLKLPPS